MPSLTLKFLGGSPRRLTQNQRRGPSHGRTFGRSGFRDGEMGRRDHAELHHIHGCAQVAVTGERPTPSDLAGAGYGVCEVQGKQRLGKMVG